MGKKGLDKMIDSIEVYIGECKPYFFSKDKIIVERAEMEDSLRELRQKLPSEVDRCNKIMSNKENILADARYRSEAIIAEAVNEANKLVDQHRITEQAEIRAEEIIQAAREEADRILQAANDEATEVRLGAMYYTRDKLADIKNVLSDILEQESANFRNLTESLDSDIYTFDNNISEMDAGISLLAANSNIAFEDEEEYDDEPVEEAPKASIKDRLMSIIPGKNNNADESFDEEEYDDYDEEEYDDEEGYADEEYDEEEYDEEEDDLEEDEFLAEDDEDEFLDE